MSCRQGSIVMLAVMLSLVGANGASGAGEFLHRHKGDTRGCYQKRVEPAVYDVVTRRVMVRPAWTEIRRTPAVYDIRSEHVLLRPERTVWVDAPPAYRTVWKDVVVRPASVRWVRKRRHLLDRDEVLCKVAVPAEIRRMPMSIRVNAGARARHVLPAVHGRTHRRVLVSKERQERITHPAVYRTLRERVEVRPTRVRWVKLGGC